MSNSDAIPLRRVSFIGISRDLAARISQSEVTFTGLVYDKGYVAAESIIAFRPLEYDRIQIHVRDVRCGEGGSTFDWSGVSIPSFEEKVTSFLDAHENKGKGDAQSRALAAHDKALNPSPRAQVLEL